MSVHYRLVEDELVIVGHTFPHKEQIKALGARFDRQQKNWRVPHSEATLRDVDHLCKTLGGGLLGAPQSQPASQREPEQRHPIVATKMDGLTVSELMGQADLVLRSAFPKAIWVIGEIQNLCERGTGLFFQLSEQKSLTRQNGTVSVKATLWNDTAQHLQKRFEQRGENLYASMIDGMQSRLLCQVNLYKDRGQVSLNVLDIDANFTKGALALAREALLKELRQKGLDTKNKTKTLPAFPLHIGLISAADSRAKSDFLDQLHSYGFPGEVLFYDARMQGEHTPSDVEHGIHHLELADVDLIVITRGGGSAADLRWFDDRALAFAIAAAKVPIVAAIGHHEDVCVAEEIAFMRQKTPTAAADYLLHMVQQTKDHIDQLAQTIADKMTRRLDNAEQTLAHLSERLSQEAQTCLHNHNQHLIRTSDRLVNGALRRIQNRYHQLETTRHKLTLAVLQSVQKRSDTLNDLEKRLIARDPSPWLRKGWTQLFQGPNLIRQTHDTHPGAQLHARLLDGNLHLTVKQISKDDP